MKGRLDHSLPFDDNDVELSWKNSYVDGFSREARFRVNVFFFISCGSYEMERDGSDMLSAKLRWTLGSEFNVINKTNFRLNERISFSNLFASSPFFLHRKFRRKMVGFSYEITYLSPLH